ncbi:MAG: hypothetical protein E7425_06820 [Ruminococcaceae bacterium]|nr:hypothetical protein [Oscillospiraceae bacterium]
MKKILSFALIAVMLFTVTANVCAAGIVPKSVKGGPTLSFDGTTAKCTVAIRESGKWISVTMELWQGNTRVMTWTKANIFNGLQPTKTGSTVNGNTLPVSAGANFFRVFYDPTHAFSPVSYAEMTFAPYQALNVEKVTFLIAVNGYCQRTSSLFADRVTRFLFVRSAQVDVYVGYMTNDGIMVPTNDTVTVTIENPQWDNPNMRYKEGYATIQNEDTCHVSLTAPQVRGDGHYNLVYTTIVSQNYGTLVNYVQMALLDKYDDGELNRPCRHNGACGLL